MVIVSFLRTSPPPLTYVCYTYITPTRDAGQGQHRGSQQGESRLGNCIKISRPASARLASHQSQTPGLARPALSTYSAPRRGGLVRGVRAVLWPKPRRVRARPP